MKYLFITFSDLLNSNFIKREMKNTNEDFNTFITGVENKGHKLPINLWLNILPMNPLVKVYFGLLLIFPFLAFIISTYLNVVPYYTLGMGAILLIIILAFTKKIIVPAYIYPLILFCIYYSTWDFFNGRYEEFGIIKLVFKNYSLHTIAVLLIIENAEINFRFLNTTLKIFKILALLTFIVSLIQFIFTPYFFAPKATINLDGNTGFFRNSSIWGYLGDLDIGLSFLPIMAIVINNSLIKNKFKQSIFWLLISGLVAFMNSSRWIMINFALLLLLPIYLIKGSKIKNIAFSIMVGIIAILFLNELLNMANINVNKFIENRIFSKSANTRLLAIDLFSKFFPSNPLIGSGVRVSNDLGNTLAGRSSQIHVGYLSQLYEFGIVGGIFLFSFWFSVAKKFYKSAKMSKQYGAFVGFLCFLFANLTLVEYSMFHIGIIFLFVFDRIYNIKYALDKFSYTNNEIIS
jgi:hypothetical protein